MSKVFVGANTYKAMHRLAARPMTTRHLRVAMKCKQQAAVNICARMFHRGLLAKRRGALASNGQTAVEYYVPDPSRLADLHVYTNAELAQYARAVRTAMRGYAPGAPAIHQQAEVRPVQARTLVVDGVELEAVSVGSWSVTGDRVTAGTIGAAR